jgi:hypothetical protein
MEGFMRSLSGCLLVLAGLWMGAAAPAVAAEEAKPASERELRAAMTRAEKRFFELYNRVNDDGRHEMACEAGGMTGSRLKKGRSCKTRGQSEIGEAAAREYMRGMDLSGSLATATTRAEDNASPVAQATAPAAATAEYAEGSFGDAHTRLQQERAAFERNLQALLGKHPDLRQRFDEYRLARTRYDAARQ